MKRYKNLSAKSIRNTHGVLHKALSKAVELRYIGFNPSDACVLPRLKKKDIKPFEEVDIKAFLILIEEKDDVLKELFKVALFTGMREGEICGLSLSSIDFDKGIIQIKQQLLKEK